MLVLSRRKDSGIRIGPGIKVTVLSVRRQQVSLGIEAPDDVRIWRDELDVDLFEEQPQAAAPLPIHDARMKIVLVIEDDPLHAKMIRKSLCRAQGMMVTVAETAKLALDALGTLADESAEDDIAHPDLILLDVSLPDGSGVEVLRSIRKDDRLRRTPVVMLTSSQDDTVVNECLESGANAYVVKSSRWNDFRDSVSRIGEFWTNDYFAPQRSFQDSRAACLPLLKN